MKNLKLLSLLILCIVTVTTVFANNERDYKKAIVRSALHDITLADSELKTIQGKTVTMVVFTGYTGYRMTDTQLGATIWTTVAPEVKTLCRNYVKQQAGRGVTHRELSEWLASLLGLSIKNAEKRAFVELEVPVIQAYYGVSPSEIGIFRPCTDPRITVHKDDSPICPKQMNPADPYISSAYKTWFINNGIVSHTLQNGYPWTGYGYTYHVDSDEEKPFGASEFVVLKGTPINLLENQKRPGSPYVSAEEYCM